MLILIPFPFSAAHTMDLETFLALWPVDKLTKELIAAAMGHVGDVVHEEENQRVMYLDTH
jgi:hypothetical protein